MNGLSCGTRPDDRRQASNFAANGQSDLSNNNFIDGYSTVLSTDFNFKGTYLQQYRLNVEKDFNGNVLTLAYVGNKGSRIVLNNTNVNLQPCRGAAFPFASLPNVTILERRSNHVSLYNSAQISVQRRLVKGLAANVNYTCAHNLTNAQVIDEGQPVGNCFGAFHVDNGNGQAVVYNIYYQYNYGNADHDTLHRIALAGTYRLPLGSRHHRLSRPACKGPIVKYHLLCSDRQSTHHPESQRQSQWHQPRERSAQYNQRLSLRLQVLPSASSLTSLASSARLPVCSATNIATRSTGRHSISEPLHV